jgi:hypothetical protein
MIEIAKDIFSFVCLIIIAYTLWQAAYYSTRPEEAEKMLEGKC